VLHERHKRVGAVFNAASRGNRRSSWSAAAFFQRPYCPRLARHDSLHHPASTNRVPNEVKPRTAIVHLITSERVGRIHLELGADQAAPGQWRGGCERPSRGLPAGEKPRGCKLTIPASMFDRLHQTAIKRGKTMSELAGEILHRNLPHVNVELLDKPSGDADCRARGRRINPGSATPRGST
jgi:hypothetical protein